MLPKAFYLLMLPLAGLAVARPDLLTAVVPPPADERTAATASAPPPPSVSAGYGSKRLIAGRDGHFRARATAGGRQFEMLVDTGATIVALTWRTGLDLGLVRPGQAMDAPMQTANGRVMGRRVTIPYLEVEGIAVSSVPAVVLPAGALGTNLLGMSYLSRLRRFEFARNTLVLER